MNRLLSRKRPSFSNAGNENSMRMFVSSGAIREIEEATQIGRGFVAPPFTAASLESGTCPPEGGRYIKRGRAAKQTFGPAN